MGRRRHADGHRPVSEQRTVPSEGGDGRDALHHRHPDHASVNGLLHVGREDLPRRPGRHQGHTTGPCFFDREAHGVAAHYPPRAVGPPIYNRSGGPFSKYADLWIEIKPAGPGGGDDVGNLAESPGVISLNRLFEVDIQEELCVIGGGTSGPVGRQTDPAQLRDRHDDPLLRGVPPLTIGALLVEGAEVSSVTSASGQPDVIIPSTSGPGGMNA